jgi:hypothetical protein
MGKGKNTKRSRKQSGKETRERGNGMREGKLHGRGKKNIDTMGKGV